MPIQAICQQCGASLPVPDEYAGQSVRCGGCRGVVKVPERALPAAPLAKAPRARPVAVPVARKAPEAPKPDPAPLPKARKVRDDADTPTELELDPSPPKKNRERTRPLARKRRESILTPTAAKWLVCFLLTGTVSLGILVYASWGKRKNDGTALTVPAEDRR